MKSVQKQTIKHVEQNAFKNFQEGEQISYKNLQLERFSVLMADADEVSLNAGMCVQNCKKHKCHWHERQNSGCG
jgi:hypothetical protein